jgi:tRNA A-37 threonylcarbamoyl transferase component Bud32
MAFVEIEPRYQEEFRRRGLVRAEDFLSLPGVIVSGHPNRHVARVEIQRGSRSIVGFIKREHRVPWKERLESAVAGFGLVSKSVREGAILRMLARAGVSCPEALARGEDENGRAFVLVRELTGAVDLRVFLRQHLQSRSQRPLFFSALGREVAKLHAAGFEHRDFYSAHVLVEPMSWNISFLDVQRCRMHPRVSWQARLRDLATLDATLADDLAGPEERSALVRAYRSTVLTPLVSGASFFGSKPQNIVPSFEAIASGVRRRSRALAMNPRMRELRQSTWTHAPQALLWLDGEALCVTPGFQSLLGGTVPDWLRAVSRGDGYGARETRKSMELPDGRHGLLIHRHSPSPLRAAWAWLRGRPQVPVELQQARMIFHLERHGIRVPELLAVGRRPLERWRQSSFLLIAIPETTSLRRWLEANAQRCNLGIRRRLIRNLARVLRRLAHAGYAVTDWKQAFSAAADQAGPLLAVENGKGDMLQVTVQGLHHLRRRKEGLHSSLWRLRCAWETRPLTFLSRTDRLRFLLTYLDEKRLTPWSRRFARAPSRCARAGCRPDACVIASPTQPALRAAV